MINTKNTDVNVLILYDATQTYVKTTLEYLDSFQLFSKYNISYAAAVAQQQYYLEYENYDVIILHYSIRLSFDWHMPKAVAAKLAAFKGLKLAFVQDEYDHTEMIWHHIKTLGINILFTCVPEASINQVYPQQQFPDTTFISVLTGYVPLEYQQLEKYITPLSERNTLIAYRGRKLQFKYGNLTREKYLIGLQVKEYCKDKPYKIDIAWDERDRIYGDNWYKFLGGCRATLGTESGSNVFDFDGQLAQKIDDELKNDPAIDYDIIHEKYLREHDGKIEMNQISPKIFESIVLRTALVLFEGKYSGVIEADKHYIPLKRDLSNIEDVLAKLQDIPYLESLTQRAFNDVILSGNYEYKKYIAQIDNIIEKNLSQRDKQVRKYNDSSYYAMNAAALKEDNPARLFQTVFTNKPISAEELAVMNHLQIIRHHISIIGFSNSLLGSMLLKQYFILQKLQTIIAKFMPRSCKNLLKQTLFRRHYQTVSSE